MPAITRDFCYILDGAGGGRRASFDKLPPREAIVWVHWDYQDPRNRERIHKMNLGKPVMNSLLDANTHPRFFTYRNGFVVVLRGVNMSGTEDIEDMIALRVWVEKNRIVTLSHRSLAALDEVLALLRKKQGPRTPADCCIALAQEITRNIAATVIKIEDEVDDVEETVIEEKERFNKNLHLRLSVLRHKIIGLRRYVVPQKEMIGALKGLDSPLLSEKNAQDIHELSLNLTKVVDDLNFARDHTNMTQEELDSKANSNLGQVMYLMSMVMFIFTPVTFITGLLGSNVGGIPFQAEEGFLFVVGFLLLILIFQLILLKKMKWF